MITAIEIENFKGIGERTRVEIKPITLLFGPNSVGKSTILHAMQLAREIMTRGNVDTDQIATGALDLGGFRQYVHNHDVTKPVRLRFELDMSREDLLTEFPVPECRIANPNLPEEDKEDISSIGDEVFDAWVEFEITAQVTSVLTALVSTLTVGLNGEPFARLSIQPARSLTELNVRHPLIAWDRITDDSVGRLDAIWPATRPLNDAMFFTGEPVTWEELENPPDDVIICKAPVSQAEDETDWVFRASSQNIDLGDMEVLGDELYVASPDGRYLRRWGIRYTADQADADTGREYVEREMQTAMFPEDKSSFCRSGFREVVDWATLHEPIRMRGMTESPVNLTRRLLFEPGSRPICESDDPATRPERFGVYVALLNRLILGPVSVLCRELSQVRHVGPVRERVPRQYQPHRFTDPSRWHGGLAAWDELFKDKDLSHRVSRWLEDSDRLNTGYQLLVHAYREAPPELSLVRSENAEDDLWVTQVDVQQSRKHWETFPLRHRLVLQPVGRSLQLEPADLGQGITQMVPVVTAALMPGTPGDKPKGTLVAIEQPELHVHPKQQAALGDVFIAATLSPPGNRLLIETHSEHLVLRLLRRIRETAEKIDPSKPGVRPVRNSLMPEDLGVLYVQARSEIEPGATGIVIHTLRVDETGEFIDRWPKGFFEERSEELF